MRFFIHITIVTYASVNTYKQTYKKKKGKNLETMKSRIIICVIYSKVKLL